MTLLAAGLLTLLAVLPIGTASAADGRITITVDGSIAGSRHGFSSSYGAIDGELPGFLFGDGQGRAVASIYEDQDGYWSLTYSGGLGDDWQTIEELDDVTIRVVYEDGADTRFFHVGGFEVDRPGPRTLQLAPPLPAGPEWAERNGELLVLTFERRPEVVPRQVGPVPEPTAAPDSFVEWLSKTTPGGGVIAQALITLIVSGMVLFKTTATPFGVISAAVAIVLTPWIPTFFGFGDSIAASIVGVNVAAGAFTYKVFVARTEA